MPKNQFLSECSMILCKNFCGSHLSDPSEPRQRRAGARTPAIPAKGAQELGHQRFPPQARRSSDPSEPRHRRAGILTPGTTATGTQELGHQRFPRRAGARTPGTAATGHRQQVVRELRTPQLQHASPCTPAPSETCETLRARRPYSAGGPSPGRSAGRHGLPRPKHLTRGSPENGVPLPARTSRG